MSVSRHNFKWNVNECLQLQREYQLLEWPVDKIALKHKRTLEAIMYKLEKEGIIENWVAARGHKKNNYRDDNSTESETESDSSEYLPNDNEEEEEDEKESICESDVSDKSNPVFHSNNLHNKSLNSRISSLEKNMEDVKVMLSFIKSKLNKIK
jgi:hypothetical protein